MKVKSVKASPEHEVAYTDLLALVSKHAASMSEIEILAVASNMLGKLIAMQDQRIHTHEMVMEIVSENIEAGNAQIIKELQASKGSA